MDKGMKAVAFMLFLSVRISNRIQAFLLLPELGECLRIVRDASK